MGSAELIQPSDFNMGKELAQAKCLLLFMAQFRASRKHVVKPRTPKKNIRKTEPTEKRGEHRECRLDARKNFVNGHVDSDLHLSDLPVPMISFGRRTCTARSA